MQITNQRYETICHEEGYGWHCFRDLEDDGFGQYLYKRFKNFMDEFVIVKRWIRPSLCTPDIREYFDTKEDAVNALKEAG